MQLSDWVRDNLLAMAVIFLFVATLTAVSAGSAFVWLVLAVLGGGPVVDGLGTLLPLFAVGLIVGLPLSVVAFLGISYGLVARLVAAASEATSELAAESARRVGRGVRRVERRASVGGLVDVSDFADAVDPRSPEARAEDRIEQLKARYVEGRLSEFEFERRVRAVLVDENVSRELVTSLDAELGGVRREQEY